MLSISMIFKYLRENKILNNFFLYIWLIYVWLCYYVIIAYTIDIYFLFIYICIYNELIGQKAIFFWQISIKFILYNNLQIIILNNPNCYLISNVFQSCFLFDPLK